MFASSIASKVAEAAKKNLEPSIGLVPFLMGRWSCSTIVLRYLIRPILIDVGQPNRFYMRFVAVMPAVLAPFLWMTILPWHAIYFQRRGGELSCRRHAAPS